MVVSLDPLPFLLAYEEHDEEDDVEETRERSDVTPILGFRRNEKGEEGIKLEVLPSEEFTEVSIFRFTDGAGGVFNPLLIPVMAIP